MNPADDLRGALHHGNTIIARAFLSWCAIFQGAGYFLCSPSQLTAPTFNALDDVVPIQVWGVGYLAIGVFGWWRVRSRTSRLGWAWAVNVSTFAIWTWGGLVRVVNAPTSLLSPYPLIFVLSLWCLMRTEATRRDVESA